MRDRNMAGGLLLAGLTVLIWGTTYVATKTLLRSYQPLEILLIRFTMAYAILWAVHPRRPAIRRLSDELAFFALGLTGITLYFILEVYALKLSYASNVGFIVSTIPLLTALLARATGGGRRFGWRELGCYLIGLGGVFLILFNGYFVLKLNPKGDLLALGCALVWAVYSLMTNRVARDYGRLMVVRKTIFYGLATMVPALAFLEVSPGRIAAGLTPLVLANLLYLACIASVACLVMWNVAIARIGAIRTSSFIYFVPLITMASSALWLKEKITPAALAGGAMILGGVYLFQWLSRESAGNR